MQLYKLHSHLIRSHLHLIMSHNFSFAFNVGPNHFSFAFNSVSKNSCLQFYVFMIAGRYNRNRLKYYEAIQSVRKNNMDMTQWLEYFTNALSSQITEIQQKSATFTKYEHLKENNKLSARQISLINYIIEFGEINIKIYESLCLEASKRTLQRELKELLDMNLLDAKGHTNNRIYTLKLVTNL